MGWSSSAWLYRTNSYKYFKRCEQQRCQESLKVWVFMKSNIQKIQSYKLLMQQLWQLKGFDSATCQSTVKKMDIQMT